VAGIRELAETWASVYAGSAALRSLVSFLHMGGLLTAGGCAIAGDLGMLRALNGGPVILRTELDRLKGMHRLVVGGLGAVIASGLLLMLADLEAYLASRAFWLKMILVIGLCLNGVAVVRTSGRAWAGQTGDRRRLRLVVAASLALWLLTTLMGTVLPNAL
jgi:hypothetical protein